MPSRRADEFDALYASTPPWDIGRPQPAFSQLARTDQLRGRILDVGCGTGEHALMAAALGLETVGVDAAPSAIAIAKHKAEERRLQVRFLVADALDLPSLAATFDTVLDCGLFHSFDDDERARYVDSLRAVIPIGGHYHMLCFSDRQPGDWGPRRIRSEEIVASFADGWRIEFDRAHGPRLDHRPERGQCLAGRDQSRRDSQRPKPEPSWGAVQPVGSTTYAGTPVIAGSRPRTR